MMVDLRNADGVMVGTMSLAEQQDANFAASQPAWLACAGAAKSLVDAGGPLAYGEQCADTDGLAVVSGTRLATDEEINMLCRHLMDDVRELRAECAKLVERCVQAEVNATRAQRECEALRVELAQRKALPLNALRHGGIR